MKVPRAERLVDMTNYIVEHPYTHISLNFFVSRYDSAKSSISEDLSIIKKTLKNKGLGDLETTTGTNGGISYVPYMPERDADDFANEMYDLVNDPTRVLPGGYIYLSDILARPDVLRRFGRLIASQYKNQKIQAVMTVATKGIPVAIAIAQQLNVPYVVARSGLSKVTEGPTLSTPFTTGTSKQVNKLELSTRSLEKGLNVIIVDDFMKAGGTIIGLNALAEQFEAKVKGIAVFAEGRSKERKVENFTSLIHVDTNLDSGEKIKVQLGNYKQNIYVGEIND
ncbi:MAG: pur operon repressor [Lactobacillaceae bacterium]|jgi:purine operon repressor|nr:pur operon repressor [Lactobacillaceae bacterium]